MITIDKFVSDNNGKPLEVAGSSNALNQCVDLANGYIRDVLGQKIIEHCNAQDFPLKADKNVYDYILNSPTNEPIRGDIVIFKHKDGIGHISVMWEKVDGNNVKTFDENWPLKSPCKFVIHPYNFGKFSQGLYEISGWLRCKIKPVINSEENMTDNEKAILGFIREKNITETQVRQGYGYVSDKIGDKVKALEDSVKRQTVEIGILNGKLTAMYDSEVLWQKDLKTANEKIGILQKNTLQGSDDKSVFNEAVSRLLKIFKK